MIHSNQRDYGKGVHVIGGDGVLAESAKEFAERLRIHFTSPGYTPPLLPAVALEIHSLAQRTEVDAENVVAVMEKDPLLAGRVLKIAQSAAYAPVQQITSLRDAVVRLGLRNLSEIAWEVSLNMRIFRSHAYAEPMELVRLHSIATAHLARMVSSHTAIPSEYAFLCGLLHDVGMAAALIVLDEQKDTARGVDPGMLGLILNMCHEEASGVVTALWRLPADVQLVVRYHHEVVIQGVVHPLAAIVAVAEFLARELGFGVPLAGQDCDTTHEQTIRRALAALHFDMDQLQQLRAEAKERAAHFDAENKLASTNPNKPDKTG